MLALILGVLSVGLKFIASLFSGSTTSAYQDATPGEIEKTDFPTADEGDEVPKVFGRRVVKGNVVTVFNKKSEPIYKTASGGKGK